MAGTPEFKAWVEAKQRCHNPNNGKFKWYGARGIAVCKEWLKNFSAFYDHVGPRPNGTSLDRIDNSKGYEPGNVRWAPKIVQANNTRFNKQITALGRTQTMAQWACETGLKQQTIWARLEVYNMTPDQAVTLSPGEILRGRPAWNKGIKGTGRKPKKLENV